MHQVPRLPGSVIDYIGLVVYEVDKEVILAAMQDVMKNCRD